MVNLADCGARMLDRLRPIALLAMSFSYGPGYDGVQAAVCFRWAMEVNYIGWASNDVHSAE